MSKRIDERLCRIRVEMARARATLDAARETVRLAEIALAALEADHCELMTKR